MNSTSDGDTYASYLQDYIKIGALLGGSEHKVAAYAYDSLILMPKANTAVIQIRHIMDTFSSFSISKINVKKSKALCLGLSHNKLNCLHMIRHRTLSSW